MATASHALPSDHRQGDHLCSKYDEGKTDAFASPAFKSGTQRQPRYLGLPCCFAVLLPAIAVNKRPSEMQAGVHAPVTPA